MFVDPLLRRRLPRFSTLSLRLDVGLQRVQIRDGRRSGNVVRMTLAFLVSSTEQHSFEGFHVDFVKTNVSLVSFDPHTVYDDYSFCTGVFTGVLERFVLYFCYLSTTCLNANYFLALEIQSFGSIKLFGDTVNDILVKFIKEINVLYPYINFLNNHLSYLVIYDKQNHTYIVI